MLSNTHKQNATVTNGCFGFTDVSVINAVFIACCIQVHNIIILPFIEAPGLCRAPLLVPSQQADSRIIRAIVCLSIYN